MSWNSKERRKFVRIKFPCELHAYDSKKEPISTYTENISAGGIRVLITKRLIPSSIIKLDLYGINDKSIICKGKILWVFRRKNPLDKKNTTLYFDTGIEFYDISNDDRKAIKKLIASILTK